jgi:hypothetical protein
MYSNFGDAAASRQLSKARGSDWLVIPASSAVELLTALDRIECEAGDVTAFAASEHGPDSAAEEAAAVQVALTALKAWHRSAIARIGRALVYRLGPTAPARWYGGENSAEEDPKGDDR